MTDIPHVIRPGPKISHLLQQQQHFSNISRSLLFRRKTFTFKSSGKPKTCRISCKYLFENRRFEKIFNTYFGSFCSNHVALTVKFFFCLKFLKKNHIHNPMHQILQIRKRNKQMEFSDFKQLLTRLYH